MVRERRMEGRKERQHTTQQQNNKTKDKQVNNNKHTHRHTQTFCLHSNKNERGLLINSKPTPIKGREPRMIGGKLVPTRDCKEEKKRRGGRRE
jgi:hypothetical protein